MEDITSKLALIVCEQCKRNEDESDIDFSTHLLSVYQSCYENITNILQRENLPSMIESVDGVLRN